MLQDVVKTVVMSAVSRVMESMGTLYFAITATLIVAVCGFFLYKRFFTKSVVAELEPKQAPEVMEPTYQKETPQEREEAFAAAIQADQDAAEQELQKRIAAQKDTQQETSDHEQQPIQHVE